MPQTNKPTKKSPKTENAHTFFGKMIKRPDMVCTEETIKTSKEEIFLVLLLKPKKKRRTEREMSSRITATSR
jgi:hypothetical protein